MLASYIDFNSGSGALWPPASARIFTRSRLHGKIPQREIPHFGRKPRALRHRSLIEGDTAPERGFEGATRPTANMVQHESLEQKIDLIADSTRDVNV